MSSEDRKHRSHLPMPTPERTGLITYDARDPDTKFPPIEQLRPPKGAPNYCRRYRPAARHPEPVDTSTSHVGFRCVVRQER